MEEKTGRAAGDDAPKVQTRGSGTNRNHHSDQAPQKQTPQPRRTSWRDVIAVHPAADIFPMMPRDELIVLGEDIKKNGLRNRVAVIKGPDDEPILIDGRNRLDAMELVGLKIVLEDVAVLVACGKHRPGFDPYDYVLSANIHRRHLTAEQKRDLIAKLLKATPGKSNRQIAKAVDVSHPHVGKVRAELESTGDVETVTTSIDTKGRKQPAKRAIQPKPIEPPDEEQDMDVESPQVIENTAMDNRAASARASGWQAASGRRKKDGAELAGSGREGPQGRAREDSGFQGEV
jgi:hypothetical protein